MFEATVFAFRIRMFQFPTASAMIHGHMSSHLFGDYDKSHIALKGCDMSVLHRIGFPGASSL